jgi:predicted nucleic acid-binding protein
MKATPKVVLDANVLFPPTLRDTLLRMASAGLFEPCWSRKILSEVERSLLRRTTVSEVDVRRLFTAMNRHFPRALTEGFERHIPFLRNDSKDRHVVAAAVEADAATIVTFNLRDFFALPDSIDALAPAEFLLRLLRKDREAVLRTLGKQVEEARRPPNTLPQLLQRLEILVKPFTDEVRKLLGERPPDGS